MSSQDFEGPQAEGAESEHVEPPGDEVAGYAAEVRAQFADLSDAESAELLEDLEDHLSEVAAEDAGTLRERLGAPAAYARELRQAAGLPEPGEGSGSGGPAGGAKARRTLRFRARSKVRGAVAEAERQIRVNPAGAAVLDFLPSLRPAWWVLRGWVVARVLQVMTTDVDPWHDFSLIPRVGYSTLIGALMLVAAIVGSVYVGRRTFSGGWRGRLVTASQGALVVFTVAMALSAIQAENDDANTAAWGRGPSPVSALSQARLSEDGQPVTNLYVYDQSGKLLNGVLVYDQDGRPVNLNLSLHSDGPFANDGWIDGNGALVANIFPRRLLQLEWNAPSGQTQYVTVPPPLVTVPQGVHRDPGPGDPQQSPATSAAPSATPTTSPTSSSTTPAPSAGTTPAPSATTTPAGAQTPSALPSTPAPPDATH